ncbi:MAG: alpha/beta fold hydrolase [Burkholderiales bacterium]
MNRNTRAGALLLTLCLTLAPAAASADPAVPPFYAAVARLAPEGRLGQVVKQERVATTIPGAQAWRIAYVSSDVGERKTLATALVVAPVGVPPAGGRPVVAWAHGTTGTAQSCGPSQLLDPANDLNEYFLVGGDSWTDYGLPNLAAFVKEGYVVVGTDYQGLGGGGRHQYAVAATQARDVINAVRAVDSVRAFGAGRKAVVYGWSQGGGATLAAAGLPDYVARTGTAADGVQFIGFVAMAPQDVAVAALGKTLDGPTSEAMMSEMLASFGDSVFNFAHFAMGMWGTQAAYPDLRLTDFFTDEGAATLDKVFRNKCMHAGADTIAFVYGSGYKSLLLPQPKNAQAWARALVEGSVAPVKPVAPVMIYYGTKDTTVPPAMGQAYQAQMCKLGGNVGRVQLPGEQSHFTTPGAALPLYAPWIRDRFAGKPAAAGCPQG